MAQVKYLPNDSEAQLVDPAGRAVAEAQDLS